MNLPQLVISVERGRIQEIFCTQAEVEVLLVDWDVDVAEINHPAVVEVSTLGRERALAYVARLPVQPVEALLGSRAATAIETAEHAVC